MKYYFQERPYGDGNAIRFEKEAVLVSKYNQDCVGLTYPYTPLTWLMVEFITSYYLADVEGFDRGDERFWERARRSPLYLYEVRVNRSPDEFCRKICENVVSIYQEILCDGFNLAKPVPVAENPRGRIVALKGAKRIAALIALGARRVPVAEYARDTLASISAEQVSTTCINHAELIFRQLSDLPAVRALEAQYLYCAEASRNRAGEQLLAALEERMAEMGRADQYRRFITEDCPLSFERYGIKPGSAENIALVIDKEIEVIVWMVRRGIAFRAVIGDKALYGKLSPLLAKAGIEVTGGKRSTIGGVVVDMTSIAEK